MLGKKIRFNKKNFEYATKRTEKESYSSIYDYIKKLAYYIHDNNPRGYPINTKHPKSDGRLSIQKVYETLVEDIRDEKLYSNFDQEKIINNWVKKGTINRWLTKRNKEGNINYYKLKDLPEEIRIYTKRLYMLEKNLNSGLVDFENLNDHEIKFSKEYKTAIERCFYGFNDPTGEKVDLLAQREVIIEIDARLVQGFDTEDIDYYLALTPWLDNGKVYKNCVNKDNTKAMFIKNIILEDINLEDDNDIWREIWHFMGHQKYINPTMIINAELRLPWYVAYYYNDEYPVLLSRDFMKRNLDSFDKGFESEYNIKGLYNYFTMDELINYHRSKGGWKGLLHKEVYKHWMEKQENVFASLGNSKWELVDKIKDSLTEKTLKD